MKRVQVYFEFFGKNMKTELTVSGDYEVAELLAERINVLKVETLEDMPDNKTNDDNGKQLFDFLFGGKQK